MKLLKEDLKFAYEYLDFIVNDAQTVLPSQAPNGAIITWYVLDGRANIIENKIYKLEGALENEVISLKVKVEKDNLSLEKEIDNLILKDEYVANIMSYFTNRDDTRGMKLSYSYDCKDFYPLNKGKSVIKPTIGSLQMRDPAIFRTKCGGFGVLATQGWDNPEIYLWDTQGLVNFSNERLISVANSVGKTEGEQRITKKELGLQKLIMIEFLINIMFIGRILTQFLIMGIQKN